jgi:hypothetical protein
MTKPSIFALAGLAVFPLATTALAGDMVIMPDTSVTDSGRSLKSAINTLTNPTLFESAIPQTRMRGMVVNHQTPDTVSALGNGTQVPVGGDVNIIALQLEYALNDRLSIVASKDGFIDFNPSSAAAAAGFTDQTGFANLAAGLKYAFIYDEVNDFAMSVTAQLELPTGNRDVFQGFGDGAALLTLSAVKLHNKWQFSGASGIHIPFDSDSDSTTGFASAHVSYQLTERFTPVFEVNAYHTFSAGGNALPTDFEGGGFFNFGSPNGDVNATIVTAAVGARYSINDALSLGAAYEVPLTEEEENFMESRLTLDFVYKF